MNFPKYPSISNLHKTTDILQCSCVVTEKVHGTNTRVMFNAEKFGLVLGSRENTIYAAGSRIGELYGFTDYALKNIEPKLKEAKRYYDYVFYGEFFGAGIQKGVSYCEGKEFLVFDILEPNTDRLLDWDEVKKVCEIVGFKTVPEIMSGMITVADLEAIRDNVSVVGKDNGYALAF